ncbi:hypothetical protein CS0771_25140 [Catellatospora sp. IY07-71]|nr:hypothetical protein CS0771_25140 [Catellatospora sp. IY07-71]
MRVRARAASAASACEVRNIRRMVVPPGTFGLRRLPEPGYLPVQEPGQVRVPKALTGSREGLHRSVQSRSDEPSEIRSKRRDGG